MAYLKISSKSATNPVDMFTLGVSTSRGDDTKIGQFGSGSLMASLLWLRQYKTSPVFILNGVRVEFSVREEKTQSGSTFNRVYQHVDGFVDSALSVCCEYGEVEWTEPHMALREFISNAIDQGEDINRCVSIVESIDVDDTEHVCVYIPLNSYVRHYAKHIGQYFLHATYRQDLKTIQKDKPSACRVYRRGVFVKELPDMLTLFDYNIDIPVTESRNQSSDSYVKLIGEVLHGETEVEETYHSVILRAVIAGAECWEVSHPCYLYGQWRDFLKGLQNTKLVKIGGKAVGSGHPVPTRWYEGFVAVCPELSGYDDKLAVELDIVVRAATDAELSEFQDTWDCIQSLQPGQDAPLPTICVMSSSNGSQLYTDAKFDAHRQRILVNADYVSKPETIVKACCLAMSESAYDSSSCMILLLVRSLAAALNR